MDKCQLDHRQALPSEQCSVLGAPDTAGLENVPECVCREGLALQGPHQEWPRACSAWRGPRSELTGAAAPPEGQLRALLPVTRDSTQERLQLDLEGFRLDFRERFIPRGCWSLPRLLREWARPHRAPGVFGELSRDTQGGVVGVSGQEQGRDWMVPVGPFQLGKFSDLA